MTRTIPLAALTAAPVLAALGGLAALGLLAWPAAAAAAACGVAASAAVSGHVQRHLRRVAERAGPDPGREGPPGPPSSRLFAGLDAALHSARAEHARELRRLRGRLDFAETVLGNLPYPLILVDDERRVVSTTVGVTEVIGPATPGSDLSSVLRDPGILDAVDRVLAGGGRELVEMESLGPVRAAFSVQMQVLDPLPGGERAVVLALHDITENKRIHEARTDFVANASHELKTPLAVLAACTNTLQGAARDDPGGQRRFVAMMAAQITRMTRLIEDLLSLSQIEMNERVPPDGSVDLPGLLDEVARSLRPLAAERGIGIEVEAGPAGPEVPGDPAEIAQLFHNLVENAVRYSGDGSTVRISARDSAKVDGVEASVADDGPGIPEEHLPRLTERFYRVDAVRSRELGGTGLGLAIVKHIVGRHRGLLDIESEPGRGSVFTVHLPAPGRRGGGAGVTQV